jgi:hypothetical protein
MTCFLTISIGESADVARPLVASTDPEVVRASIRAILGMVDSRGPRGIFPSDAQVANNTLHIPLTVQQTEDGSLCVAIPSPADIALELERAEVLERAASGGDTALYRDGLLALAAWHREHAAAMSEAAQREASWCSANKPDRASEEA